MARVHITSNGIKRHNATPALISREGHNINLCVILKVYNLYIALKKYQEESHMTDNCQNNWSTCYVNCQVMKFKNRWRDCLNLKEMKELWHAIWDWTLDQRKNTAGKTVKIFQKGMQISQVDKLRPAGHLFLQLNFLKHSHYRSCVVYSCSSTMTQVNSRYGDPTDNKAKNMSSEKGCSGLLWVKKKQTVLDQG